MDQRSQFIRQMMPHAQRAAAETGIDPRLILAQSALETGWGKSAPGNNYFGIKSHGKPGGNVLQTTEFRNGQMTPEAASFMAYDGMAESAQGYAQFIKDNPRYTPLQNAQGLEAQIEALGQSGYATDPDYASKIRQIATNINLEEPLIVARDLDGQMPVSEIQRVAENGILTSQQPDFSEISGITQNTRPDMSGQVVEGALSQSGGVIPEQQSLMERLMPDMTDQQRQDRLLAIGAGLLSGSNWTEGFAGASNNLFNLTQSERSSSPSVGSRGYRPAGNLEMTDGTVRGDLSYDFATGRYVDGNGNDLTTQVAREINNSDAYGSKGQLSGSQAQKTETKLREQKTTLATLDRTISNVEQSSTGYKGLQRDLETFMNTLIGRGLTEEEIRAEVARGDIQGLVGATREQVVGGGVMTEQDALRVLMALGGDMSWRSNPEVIQERLGIIREQVYDAYSTGYDFYANHNEKYPNLGYKTPDRYEGPRVKNTPHADVARGGRGALDQSNETEEILKGYGL